MEINATNPVGSQVQGVESSPRSNEAKRESEETTARVATQPEENQGYRISLSDESRQAVAGLNEAQGSPAEDISEEDAAQLAQQASDQLAHTNAAIANQAVEKAVDLFT